MPLSMIFHLYSWQSILLVISVHFYRNITKPHYVTELQ